MIKIALLLLFSSCYHITREGIFIGKGQETKCENGRLYVISDDFMTWVRTSRGCRGSK